MTTTVRSWVLRLLLKRELEGWLACGAIVYGVWLLMPLTTFTLQVPADAASAIKLTWGVLFAGHGFGYALVLSLEHFGKLDAGPARRAAFFLTWLWGMVLTSVVLSAPFTTLTVLYGTFMLMSAWVYCRSALNLVLE